MAYQKQNFVDGKPLSAAELNRMEEGIAAAMEAGGGNTPGGTTDLTGYAKESCVQENYQPKGDYPLRNELPSVPVQSVNGKTGAVKLDAEDVGARPSTWMPTATDVGALPNTYKPPNQTAQQVGADPAGTAANAVSGHNSATDAHADIRLQLTAINDRLQAFFDSDDQTLDELSEIVAYITSNKSLIDAITTSKVSVLDIVNDLVTNVPAKPLSAAQGVVLKGLIDNLSTGKLDAAKLTEAINTALAQAKASGEFKGDPGADGQPGKDGSDGSPGKDGTSATHSWNGTVLTVTSASGTSSSDLKGAKGDKGDKGDSIKGDPGSDGVSPTVAVSKSGKVTTVSITDKNGTKTATINDGADGSPGSNGKDGTSVTVKSVSESTADGGSNVVTFSDGKTLTIKNGSKGSAGTNGKDGKTPVKGTDYWTEADQEAFVQQVIAALGTPVFGRVDADNNIILTGELAEGGYTIKYEDVDGNTIDIGTVNIGGAYRVPLTWYENTKINKTDGTIESTTDYNYMASDFVSANPSKTYTVYRDSTIGNSMSVCWYDDSDKMVRYDNNVFSTGALLDVTLDQQPVNATKFRLRVWTDVTDESIETIRNYRLMAD